MEPIAMPSQDQLIYEHLQLLLAKQKRAERQQTDAYKTMARARAKAYYAANRDKILEKYRVKKALASRFTVVFEGNEAPAKN